MPWTDFRDIVRLDDAAIEAGIPEASGGFGLCSMTEFTLWSKDYITLSDIPRTHECISSKGSGESE
jgi:hypothetical protein